MNDWKTVIWNRPYQTDQLQGLVSCSTTKQVGKAETHTHIWFQGKCLLAGSTLLIYNCFVSSNLEEFVSFQRHVNHSFALLGPFSK